MKFGKEFTTHLEETLPEWRDKFLCYKPLKKFLKNFPATAAVAAGEADLIAPHERRLIDDGSATAAADAATGEARDQVVDLQEWFVRILNEELEKFNEFYVDKEEDFVIRFQELKERIEKVKEKSIKSGLFTSEGEFGEEVMDIRKDFVGIHGEMVLLKNYSSLNFAGLVKILKKYDKRTGGLLRLPFTQLALDQPFFTTEPLTRLVHECEENLELLFPLEAEIIEPSSTQRDQSASTSNPPPQDENRTPLGEETMDIYRSTLAAIKTIRGLRKASSTYNPLSLSFLYRNLDNDDDDSSIGALTTENSAANSAANSQNGEEPVQADDTPFT